MRGWCSPFRLWHTWLLTPILLVSRSSSTLLPGSLVPSSRAFSTSMTGNRKLSTNSCSSSAWKFWWKHQNYFIFTACCEKTPCSPPRPLVWRRRSFSRSTWAGTPWEDKYQTKAKAQALLKVKNPNYAHVRSSLELRGVWRVLVTHSLTSEMEARLRKVFTAMSSAFFWYAWG